MNFDELNREIVACERCPRLRGWCEEVARTKRKSFADWDYWGKPVPNFGDSEGWGLIVGLAPAAHGANRTGRMFTGDRSGDWLYRAMHRAGLANQAEAVSADDGLELRGCVITASCHCAPPGNKPLPGELSACRDWLEATWGLREWRVVLCLGGIAWGEVFRLLGVRGPKFGHGVKVSLNFGENESRVDTSHHSLQTPENDNPTLPSPNLGRELAVTTSPPCPLSIETERGGLTILGCYHPSQQNTFTGRLTEEMLDSVMGRFAELCRS